MNEIIIIFVIGPSGVGKSSLCKKVNCKCVKYVDLDSVMKNRDISTFCGCPGSSKFGNLAMSCISKIEGDAFDGSLLLIDVGAGCIANTETIGFLKEKNELMSIVDKPENAFKRAKSRRGRYWENRSFEEYKRSEFSEVRENLYISSRYNFNVQGEGIEEAKKKFILYVKKISNLYRDRSVPPHNRT